MNHLEELAPVFRKYPEVVWCIDAVSSFAGVKIEVDALGIDVLVTSSQKCLGLPPGLSLASLSPKAEERAKGVKNRGYYFDLLQLLSFIREKNFQYPSTMSISHMFALDLQMDRITREGFDARFRRHDEMAAMVQGWARKYFALYPEEGGHLHQEYPGHIRGGAEQGAREEKPDALQRLRQAQGADLPDRPHGRSAEEGHPGAALRDRGDSEDLERRVSGARIGNDAESRRRASGARMGNDTESRPFPCARSSERVY
jgi:hypothetical protein